MATKCSSSTQPNPHKELLILTQYPSHWSTRHAYSTTSNSQLTKVKPVYIYILSPSSMKLVAITITNRKNVTTNKFLHNRKIFTMYNINRGTVTTKWYLRRYLNRSLSLSFLIYDPTGLTHIAWELQKKHNGFVNNIDYCYSKSKSLLRSCSLFLLLSPRWIWKVVWVMKGCMQKIGKK